MGKSLICLIRYDFSSENWSSSVRSDRKPGRKSRSLCLFMIKSRRTSADLFGFAAKICSNQVRNGRVVTSTSQGELTLNT